MREYFFKGYAVSEFNDVIDGIVEEIVFENDDTGYRVFTVNCDGILQTAVATCPPIYAGEAITASGQWKDHATYGRQFVCEDIEKTFPYELSGMLKFLASGAVRGIGAATAQKIVDTFKEDSFYIIENEPERLTQIRGISKEKAKIMSDSFRATLGIRDIMMQLGEYNISPNMAVKIYRRFGGFSMEIIEREPYRLWEEIDEFSFASADKIALENGFEPDCDMRLTYFIKYVLVHNQSNGHSFLPADKLSAVAAQNISRPIDEVSDFVMRMVSSGELCSYRAGGTDAVYMPAMYKAERYAADKLYDISNSLKREIDDMDMHIDKLEKMLDIKYAQNQREAIRASVENKVFVLTGGPGTGKTTTLNGIIRLYENLGFNVTLCAPTGRAAKRMSDVCGKESKTIHRLLEPDAAHDNAFVKNEGNPLKTDVLIVDEMSMVDVRLFEALLRATPVSARLILVGDADQLPSVGPGNVFCDIIRSGKIAAVFLNKVFRQASLSRIITNAHLINSGKHPFLTNSDDFFFVKKSTPDSVCEAVCALVSERIPMRYGKDVLNGLQVIIPTKKTQTGTQNINVLLRELVNKSGHGKSEVTIKNHVYREGDKVMQTKNNYDIVTRRKNGTYESGVFNGDIGIIEKIDVKQRLMSVAFEDRTAAYEFCDCDQLEPAYAITVHKSQGSEFDIVLLVISGLTPLLQYRNLLYTAVTRAKQMLIIVGSEQVLNNMVDNDKKSNRYSGLRYMLEARFGKESDKSTCS